MRGFQLSSLFQGLTDSQGRVNITLLATPVLPSSAIAFRGLALDSGRVLCVSDDGAYPRTHIGGVAIHNPTGIVIIDGAAPPPAVLPGALLSDATGSVQTDDINSPDITHQGVGLLHDGTLCVLPNQ